jgi:hypothetical protein
MNDGNANGNRALRFVLPYIPSKAIIKQTSERFHLRMDVHAAM